MENRSEDGMLTLRTFGNDPGLTRAGLKVGLGHRDLMLLVYVLVESKSRLPRDTLARMLWADSGLKAARHSLAQALYTIRKTAPELKLTIVDGELRLNPASVVVDVTQFEKAAAESEYAIAAQLYNGSFLDTPLNDVSRLYQNWCEEVRDRLTAVWQHLLERTIQSGQRSANWMLVSEASTKLLELNPTSLAWHRTRIEALYMSGELPLAQEALHDFKITCADEPGLDRVISELSAATPASEQIQHQFVGRDTEFQLLSESWLRCGESNAETTVVIGEPGIGKTSLVTHFLRYVAIKGGRTVVLSSDRRSRLAPFTTALRLIRSLDTQGRSSAASNLLRKIAAGHRLELGRVNGSAIRDKLADTLYLLLKEQAARSRAICIFLDDADHLDHSSLDILAELQTSEPPCGVHLILSIRRNSRQNSGDLLDLFRPHVRVIDLPELRPSEALRLLNSLQGNKATLEETAAIVTAAGGHPLYLTSLAFLSREGGREWMHRVPSELTQHIKQRIDTVSDPARAVLLAAAFCPAYADLALITAATRMNEQSALSAIEELAESRLVTVNGEEVFVAHGLFKDVAEQVASPVRVVTYHRRIAVHLVKAKADASVIAYHQEKAGNREAATRYLLVAIRGARRLFALAEAEQLLDRMLTQGPSAKVESRAKRQLAALYFDLRKFQLAATTYASIPGHQSTNVFLNAKIAEIAASMDSAEVAVVTAQLQRIAAEAMKADAHSAGVHALVNLAGVLMLSGPPDILSVVAEQLQLCLRSTTIPNVQRITAQTVAGQLLAMAGRFAEGRELVTNALRNSLEMNDWRASTRANSAMATICLLACEYADAVRYMELSINQCLKAGADLWRLDHLNNYGLALWCAGEIERADAIFREIANQPGRRNPLKYCSATVNLAQMWYDQGDAEKAHWFATLTLAEGGDRLGRVAIAAWAVLGLVALQRNNMSAAEVACKNTRRISTEIGALPFLSYVSVFSVRYARLTGNRRTALAEVEDLLQRGGGDGVIRSLLEQERELLLSHEPFGG